MRYIICIEKTALACLYNNTSYPFSYHKRFQTNFAFIGNSLKTIPSPSSNTCSLGKYVKTTDQGLINASALYAHD